MPAARSPTTASRTSTPPRPPRAWTSWSNGFKEGYIPKEAITYKEEEGRQAFQAGKLIFQRQWPYEYNLANGDEGTKVKGKFAVAPLPGPRRSRLPPASVATTWASRRTPPTRSRRWTSSSSSPARRTQKANLELASQAPTFTDLYDDKALQDKYPYLTTLRDSINNAVPRPRVVRYGDASTAIQDAAYAALTGTKSSADALKGLQSQLTEITGK